MESVLRRRCKNREMKNIILIYNPKAGDTTFRFSLDRFIEIFSEKDYEVRVFRSRVPGDMATFLEQTDFHDTEAVMVAGGTGTINEVVGAMIRQKIDLPVGIVPAGTENEYARYLGFNGELEDNLKALFAMTEITVDVGRVEDSYFVDSLCVGTLSTISAVSSEMRNAFGKMANYMKGAISINKLKSMKLQIETGDKRYTGIFTSFIIANEAIRKPGPLSTGKFTLIATRSTKLGREFRYLEKDYPEGQTIIRKNVISAVDGIGEVEKGVLRLTGHDFKIRIMDDDTPIHAELDGEPGPKMPINVEILPHALRVFYNPIGRDEQFKKKKLLPVIDVPRGTSKEKKETKKDPGKKKKAKQSK